MYVSNYLQSRPKGATYEEIRNYLEEKYYKDSFDGELAFSEKTFKRDRNLLNDLFGIEIVFKRSTMTYQLLSDEFSEKSKTIFDNLLLVNAYRQTTENSNILMFEKRQASGFENLDGMIHAMKNNKIISFQYTKHWEGVAYRRVIEPYALKEFRNRWYLIGVDAGQQEFFLKTFGLDRIAGLEIHHKTFTRKMVDVEQMFLNSFGIISTLDETAEQIILSFDPEQGRYIKTLPLHHSQKVIEENENEIIIKLILVPTFDFKQEILSHGARVRVMAPASLREDIRREAVKMADNHVIPPL